jgi:hypothetical protein
MLQRDGVDQPFQDEKADRQNVGRIRTHARCPFADVLKHDPDPEFFVVTNTMRLHGDHAQPKSASHALSSP